MPLCVEIDIPISRLSARRRRRALSESNNYPPTFRRSLRSSRAYRSQVGLHRITVIYQVSDRSIPDLSNSLSEGRGTLETCRGLSRIVTLATTF